MADRRLVYFTSHQVTAYSWRRGELRHDHSFGLDETGVADFSKFVASTAGSLFYVLTDVVEEDFFQENIPYVRGRDRRALLARKLAQRYRDTTLAMPLSLGSENRSGRREERILYASFTNTQQFQPWLAALRANEARLVGVFSVALVSPLVGKRIGLKAPNYLMVSLQKAGLRQSYIENGRVRFSRLGRVDFSDPRAIAENCAAESARIHNYLVNSRVLVQDVPPLDVIVFAPSQYKTLYQTACVDTPWIRFQVYDLDQLGRRIGLRSAPAETLAEGLFLYALGGSLSGEQFADDGLRRFYHLWRARVGLIGAGAAALGSCALFSAVNLIDIYQIDQERSNDRVEEARALQNYSRIQTTFPKTPIPTENLKSMTRNYRALLRQTASPGGMLAEISRAVGALPQIELERIEWEIGPTPRSQENRDTTRAAAAPTAAGIPAAEFLVQSAEISGKLIVPQASDYRAITALINQFTEALRRQPGLEVIGARLPFDINAEKSISGEIGAERSVEVPRFSVLVGRRRGT
jgi:hypothetical protein